MSPMKPLFYCLQSVTGSTKSALEISYALLERSCVLDAEFSSENLKFVKGSGKSAAFAIFILDHLLAFLANKWSLFGEEFETQAKKALSDGVHPIQIEGTLWVLAWIASRRSGHKERESRFYSYVMNFILIPEIKQAALVEHAYELMGKGCYLESLETLSRFSPDLGRGKEVLTGKVASQQGTVGDYWCQRCLVVRATCLQALGRFSECESALKNLEQFAKHGTLFRISWALRRLSLLNESEQGAKGRDFSKRHKGTLSTLPTSRILALIEELRSDLTEGNSAGAQTSLELIENVRLSSKISSAFATFVEERAELMLAKGDMDLALVGIQERLWETQKTGDFAGQCAVLQVLARVLIMQGKYFEARRALESACFIAESERYGRARARAHMLLGVCYFHEGKAAESAGAFSKCLLLAKKMGLHSTEALANLVICRLRHQETLPLAAVFLGSQLTSLKGVGEALGHLKVPVGRHWRWLQWPNHHPHFQDPLEFLENLKDRAAVVLWPQDKLLVSFPRSAHLEDVPLTSEVPLISGKLAALLKGLCLAGAGGSTLEQLFQCLEPKLKYRQERHGGRMAKEISELRSLLGTHQIVLHYSKSKRLYVLECSKPFFLIQNAINAKVKLNRLSPLQIKILEVFKSNPQMSTTELRMAFNNVSRQALHPPLKSLVELGYLSLKFRGRSSFYVLKKGQDPI